MAHFQVWFPAGLWAEIDMVKGEIV